MVLEATPEITLQPLLSSYFPHQFEPPHPFLSSHLPLQFEPPLNATIVSLQSNQHNELQPNHHSIALQCAVQRKSLLKLSLVFAVLPILFFPFTALHRRTGPVVTSPLFIRQRLKSSREQNRMKSRKAALYGPGLANEGSAGDWAPPRRNGKTWPDKEKSGLTFQTKDEHICAASSYASVP